MEETGERVYIREAAEMLDRKPATLRSWERYGWLPKELRSQRGTRGWRFWTPAQIEGIREWMTANDMRPGKGLPHYKPNAAQVHQHMVGQRRPRKRVTA